MKIGCCCDFVVFLNKILANSILLTFLISFASNAKQTESIVSPRTEFSFCRLSRFLFVHFQKFSINAYYLSSSFFVVYTEKFVVCAQVFRSFFVVVLCASLLSPVCYCRIASATAVTAASGTSNMKENEPFLKHLLTLTLTFS